MCCTSEFFFHCSFGIVPACAVLCAVVCAVLCAVLCTVQVSVRKAALVALSTLMELFPAEPRLCSAWVASALPLVRDVEASIQVRLGAAGPGGGEWKRQGTPALSEAGLNTHHRKHSCAVVLVFCAAACWWLSVGVCSSCV